MGWTLPSTGMMGTFCNDLGGCFVWRDVLQRNRVYYYVCILIIYPCVIVLQDLKNVLRKQYVCTCTCTCTFTMHHVHPFFCPLCSIFMAAQTRHFLPHFYILLHTFAVLSTFTIKLNMINQNSNCPRCRFGFLP